MKVSFYDVKKKTKVMADVVEKKKFDNGRHALVGKTTDGRLLYKFVKEADFKAAKI